FYKKKIGVQSYLLKISSASPFFSSRQESSRPPGFIIAGGTMTDIGREAHLAPAQTQLSVSSYFDEAIFAQEQARLFRHPSLYVGHEKLVPEIGDWRTWPQERAGRGLVCNPDGVELLSNVCRHRQAIMLGGEAGHVTSSRVASGNLRDTGGN